MNQTSAIIGAQWGDEGKGKLADRFGQDADWVIRYQGGNNAGHTVIVDGEKYVLHLIPSGILHTDTTCLIGSGMVVNLRELMEEIDALEEAGIDVEERLRIACRAHVLFPYHQFLDSKSEEQRGDDKIGTTQKGIGPAYEDKVKREGFRFVDFDSHDTVKRHCRRKIDALSDGWEDYEASSPAELADEYMGYYERIKPLLVDGPSELESAYNAGESLLFEGAQGTLLDIDFGSYPFVTSSNSSVGGVVTGAGFPGHRLDTVIGVAKAYLTRVGKGPFPAELEGDMGEWLREQGGEYGATTGRPRRCGWLDLPLLNYSARINGFTNLALTKLDVLSGLDEIKVTVDHERSNDGPQDTVIHSSSLKSVEPQYETLPGWDQYIRDCRSWSDLPSAAKDYVTFVEDFVDVPVTYISVGPERDELILRD
jgi:adenylosuccinate synthase